MPTIETDPSIVTVHEAPGQRIISGHAVVFDRDSVDLGGFVEQFASSAVDRTLREGIDVRALAHHDPARLLGRLTARTLTIDKSGAGLHFVLNVPDTADGRDVYELVRRGDLTGASFAFSIPTDAGELWDFSGRVPRRTVLDARIRELSLVSWPAYPSTSVGVGRADRPRAAPTVALLRRRLQLATL